MSAVVAVVAGTCVAALACLGGRHDPDVEFEFHDLDDEFTDDDSPRDDQLVESTG